MAAFLANRPMYSTLILLYAMRLLRRVKMSSVTDNCLSCSTGHFEMLAIDAREYSKTEHFDGRL
jgi:hypothetical protein